ncbi:MAG: hypothetical protein ABH889_02945 [Candidatus Portnoybacteria bacterium]
MKKALVSLVLISFLGIMLVPLAVNAQIDVSSKDECTMKRDIIVGGDVGANGTCEDTETYPIDGKDSICCVLNTMYSIADWIFVILIGVASIFIIIGAMNLVMAAGDPGKVKTGRDYIMFAAIGLFVAFIARAIPGLVLMVIG